MIVKMFSKIRIDEKGKVRATINSIKNFNITDKAATQQEKSAMLFMAGFKKFMEKFNEEIDVQTKNSSNGL